MKAIFPKVDMVATGCRIAELREAAGLSVRDLQDIFGFSTPQAIYKWQAGSLLPTIDNLLILANVFALYFIRVQWRGQYI